MAIIILCLWSPSPKHRHDHHRHWLETLISIEASLSSHQLLLLRLSLQLSDKVKQLHGDCISYNKATTIFLLPVADNCYKTWSSHTTIYISSRLDHITSQQSLQNQLDVLYFVVASFTWLLWASSKNRSYLLKEHAVPPCLVLVIDDNIYGLMVALSYIWRFCPYAFLGVHVLVSRRVCVDQGAIQGIT